MARRRQRTEVAFRYRCRLGDGRNVWTCCSFIGALQGIGVESLAVLMVIKSRQRLNKLPYPVAGLDDRFVRHSQAEADQIFSVGSKG